MIIEANKLIGLPVAAEDILSKVGVIRQIIVNPENGQLMGFLVLTGFFSPAKVLSTMDIKFWDKDGIITELEENLVDQDEIVRIHKVLEDKINLFEMPAETESGKSLGKVENFLINTETGSVVKYYLKDMIGQSRFMPADKVIKIDKNIIFEDDEIELKDTVAEISAA